MLAGAVGRKFGNLTGDGQGGGEGAPEAKKPAGPIVAAPRKGTAKAQVIEMISRKRRKDTCRAATALRRRQCHLRTPGSVFPAAVVA